MQIIKLFSMSTISGHLSAGDGLLNFYVVIQAIRKV